MLRKHNERMTKQVSDLTQENRKLVEPLKQAQAEVDEYKRQLQNYEKDKMSLAVSTYLDNGVDIPDITINNLCSAVITFQCLFTLDRNIIVSKKQRKI